MKCRFRSFALCFSISVGICLEGFAQANGPESSLDSRLRSSLTKDNPRAVVLYFIASDCPVSNRMLPEMLRIEHKFSAQGVRFLFVYPNPSETAASIRDHRASYGLESSFLTDTDGVLSKSTGANTTPEAAVLIRKGTSLRPVYTGRIDDRFLSLGVERPAATRHDLEEAIRAVLAHQPVVPAGGPPVGCAFAKR